jgi:hypothetical protein
MPPHSIAPHFDVFEQGRSRLIAHVPVSVVDELRLQRGEEAFSNGIVPAIPLSAHAALDTVLGEQHPVRFTRVLTAAAPTGSATAQCKPQDNILRRPRMQLRLFAQTSGASSIVCAAMQ